MPVLGPQTYRPGAGLLRLDGEPHAGRARARAALTALEPARKAGDLKAAGFLIVNAGATALGNNKGLFAYQPLDERELHAHRAHRRRHRLGLGGRRASRLEADRFRGTSAARAIDKARLSRNPVAIEPGRYTVILEPQAVGDLVQLIAGALQARAGRRRTQRVLEAGRRQQDRREDRGRARHDLLRPAGPAAPGAAVRRTGAAARAPGVDRERRAEAAHLLALLGAEAGQGSAPAGASVAQDGRRHDVARRDDQVARSAAFSSRGSGICARSIRARFSTRASRATARSSSRTARSRSRSRTSASTSRRCSCSTTSRRSVLRPHRRNGEQRNVRHADAQGAGLQLHFVVGRGVRR